MYAYLFQLDRGPTLRRWYDVSFALGSTPAKHKEAYDSSSTALKRMGVEPEKDPLPYVAAYLQSSVISERYSDYGETYLVKTEDELSCEDLERFLRFKQLDGTLTALLAEARFR